MRLYFWVLQKLFSKFGQNFWLTGTMRGKEKGYEVHILSAFYYILVDNNLFLTSVIIEGWQNALIIDRKWVIFGVVSVLLSYLSQTDISFIHCFILSPGIQGINLYVCLWHWFWWTISERFGTIFFLLLIEQLFRHTSKISSSRESSSISIWNTQRYHFSTEITLQ